MLYKYYNGNQEISIQSSDEIIWMLKNKQINKDTVVFDEEWGETTTVSEIEEISYLFNNNNLYNVDDIIVEDNRKIVRKTYTIPFILLVFGVLIELSIIVVHSYFNGNFNMLKLEFLYGYVEITESIMFAVIVWIILWIFSLKKEKKTTILTFSIVYLVFSIVFLSFSMYSVLM